MASLQYRIFLKSLDIRGHTKKRKTGKACYVSIIPAESSRESVVAIIPAFNEAKSVSQVVKAARRYVDETVVVDDRSTDGTSLLAKKAGAKVIANGYARGAHLATLFGIQAVKSAIVVTLDADGQHPAEDIPRLLKPIMDGDAGYVTGRRNRLPPSEKPVRDAVAEIFHKDLDVGSGFRALRRKFLVEASPEKDLGFCSCGSLLLFAVSHGARAAEVPYVYLPRRFGWSKFARLRKYELHVKQARFLKERYAELFR